MVCRSPDHAEGFFLVGLPFLQSEKIAYLRQSDSKWNLVQGYSNKRSSTDQCEDIVLHQGVLYVLTSQAYLYAYPLLEKLTLGEPTHLASGYALLLSNVWKLMYIVASGYHLIMIIRVNGFSNGDNRPSRIYIYRYQITNGPVSWDRVLDIGDTALFLGNGNSVAINVGCLSGILPNHIYFTESYSLRDNIDGTISNVAVYNLTRRLYRQFVYQPQVQHPVWMRPSLMR